MCVCVFFQLQLLANHKKQSLGILHEPKEEEEEEEDATELSSVRESRFLKERSGVATGDDW